MLLVGMFGEIVILRAKGMLVIDKSPLVIQTVDNVN